MRAGLVAAVVLAVAAVLVPEASAARRTITMSGSTPTGALTADLAYFYRHSVRKPPRFSIVGGGSGTGIADAARGVVDVGLASRELGEDDPAGIRFSPIAWSGVCLVTNRANPVPGVGRPQIQASSVPSSTLRVKSEYSF